EKGTFSNEEQTVTYVYERTDAKPVTDKVENNNNNNHNENKVTKLNNKKSDQLPLAGERESSVSIAILGVIMLVVSIGGLFKKNFLK
ncbi:hypothetical protein ABG953_04690, partial [Enterococcus faecalis]|uniref:hypothetical protein n=1 Tax=Enterococcus faecalis TaxID=1351 RepID=UPI00325B4744